MAIDIINNASVSSLPPAKLATNNASDIKTQDNGEAATVTKDDSVILTATAQNMQNASSVDAAPVNEQRIQKIMTALQDGSYKVNPERVAEKMLQFDLTLPDTT